MSKSKNIRNIIQETTGLFEENGIENARFEVEIILSYLLKTNQTEIYLHLNQNLNQDEIKKFRKFIQKRIKKIPLAYIIGQQPFRYLNLKVSKDVMIPRFETELLVDQAIKRAQEIIDVDGRGSYLLDLGTGSGAIALSLAKEVEGIKVYATDISNKALLIAKENATLNNLQGKVEFFLSDLFDNIPGNIKFDIIVCNPPYIAEIEYRHLQKEVKLEPKEALWGGLGGIEFIEKITNRAPYYLAEKGCLLMEIGEKQASKVRDIFKRTHAYENIKVLKDLSERDRIIEAQKANKCKNTSTKHQK